MINKLPEVGKKYKNISQPKHIIEVFSIRKNIVHYKFEGIYGAINLEYFWDCFEIINEITPVIFQLNAEMKEVIIQIQTELSIKRECHFTRIDKLENLLLILIKTMQKQFDNIC